MRNIRFQKIMMLSYLKKKARIVDLDANFVLVRGTNHVGKCEYILAVVFYN